MSSGIEVDMYSRFQNEEEENIFDNKSLAEIQRILNSKSSSSINSQSLSALTNSVCQMVYEQHNVSMNSEKKEENKEESAQSSDQEIKNIIDGSNRKQKSYDYKSVLKKDIAPFLFENYPHVNSLLKDHSIMVFQKLIEDMDNKQSLLGYITGTRLKKVRCLIGCNESSQQIKEFDQTLKVILMLTLIG
jgi:hypothetical protein